MIAAGADAQGVSILATLVNLILSLVCVKSPAFIERVGLTKKGAVPLAFFNVCTWVPLILLFLLPRSTLAPLWFALVWLVNLTPAVLLSTQRDNWMSNLIPQGIMGRYLGHRLAIRSAFYLGAFCLGGYLLDSFEGMTSTGFAAVFAIAFLASFVDFFIFFSMNDPKVDSKKVQGQKQPEFGFFAFLGELKERKLNSFVLFTWLFGITVSLCGPLYAVYMLQELNFSYMSFTIILSIEYFARVVSVPFWGRFADSVGNIRVLNIVSRIIPLIPIFWLFSSNVAYLAFIQTLSGLCWGAYDLGIQNYLFKVAPPTKKLRYILYNKSLVLLGTALGGIVGVYFLKELPPIFGSRILSVFLISGVFRAVVVMYMLPKLVDLAVSYSLPRDPAMIDWQAFNRSVVSKAGLYYRLNYQVDYPKKPHLQLEDGLQSSGAVDASRHGMYYRSPDRVDIGQTSEEVSYSYSEQSHKGLLYHPEKWARYSKKIALPISAKIKRSAEKMIAHNGLYYDRDGWIRYKNDSLYAIMKDKKNYQNSRAMRKALLHSNNPLDFKPHYKAASALSF